MNAPFLPQVVDDDNEDDNDDDTLAFTTYNEEVSNMIFSRRFEQLLLLLETGFNLFLVLEQSTFEEDATEANLALRTDVGNDIVVFCTG